VGRGVIGAGAALGVALAFALPIARAQPLDVFAGELRAVAIDVPQDHWSPGTITIGTERIVVPALLLVELPGTTLTLQELFALAPLRCRALHETGLVRTDACRRPATDPNGSPRPAVHPIDTTPRTSLDPSPSYDPPVGAVRVTAVRASDGTLTAKAVSLLKESATASGAVTFVDRHNGFVRIGGATGLDIGGTFVRLNDPTARLSTQRGSGCSTEGNCSPDVRFRLDPLRDTVRFAAGPAACLPSDSPGDLCSRSVRPLRAPVDPSVLVPIEPGDHVTATGYFDVVDGIRILWAHTVIVETTPFELSLVPR
jgi:hypothetical protein